MSTRLAEVPVSEQSAFGRTSFAAAHVRQALATSGFLMLAFVLVHMFGNLLAFAGSATFNAYAHSIRQLGTPLLAEGALLWFARVVLASALALHLAAHAYLFLKGPTPVESESSNGTLPPWYATLPTAWLFGTGALIAAFVALHLLQLTIGVAHPEDPYGNLLSTLSSLPAAIAYIAAAVAVALHILPGIWTGMRSLDLIRPSRQTLAARLSVATPVVLVIGLSTVPVAVLLGILR